MAAQTVDCSTQVDTEALEMEEEEAKTADTSDSGGSKMGPASTESDPGSEEPVKKKNNSSRAEIDTSAPFESVKEAVSRFGGIGFWKPHSHKPSQAAEHEIEEVDISKVEEQAVQLEKDLIVKERETLDVLKELEATKLIVEELKSKLQKEASEVDAALKASSDIRNMKHAVEVAEKENDENFVGQHQNSVGGFSLCPTSAPGLILIELKQAKRNLTRTTTDLADVRATVESYNKKLEKERISLEKTRERLTLNSAKISSLEEELNQTRGKLQLVKDAEVKGPSDSPMDISRELQRLSSEAEQFKKIGEATKSEVSRAMSEIEQTKTRIKTAEIRLVAAKKMKEAARATEAVALAEIKALSSSENSGVLQQKPEGVTLSFEEYSSLTCKARDAEEASKRRVVDAMLEVDEANVSKMEILKRVEEATEEVQSSKRILEEALNRVEAANRGKLAVEEALRKWRSEHGQKRRSIHNSTKFKNSYPSHHRKDSRLLDVNGLNLVNDDSKPVLRPTLSIGQILSRKLFLTEEFEQAEKGAVKRKVSLGQMLSKPNGDLPSTQKADESGHKQFPAKRKKFGFSQFSLLATKESKKKKQTPDLRSRSR
uniref:WEB family protein n=1 Tax=Davidia involucrata TaxID=16924 RepID=A0A5B6YZY5_DAVIN